MLFEQFEVERTWKFDIAQMFEKQGNEILPHLQPIGLFDPGVSEVNDMSQPWHELVGVLFALEIDLVSGCDDRMPCTIETVEGFDLFLSQNRYDRIFIFRFSDIQNETLHRIDDSFETLQFSAEAVFCPTATGNFS